MEDWEAGWDRKKSGGPSKHWANKPFEAQGEPPHSIRENGLELSRSMIARW